MPRGSGSIGCMYTHTHIYKHIYSVCSGIVCLFTPPPPTLGHFIACWFLDQSEKLLATWLTRTRNKTDTLSDSETIPETDNNNKSNKIGGQRKEQQQIHGKIFVCLMRDKNNHKRHTKRKRQRWRDGDRDRERTAALWTAMGNGELGKISSKITEKLAAQVTKVVKKKEIENEQHALHSPKQFQTAISEYYK